MSCCGGNRAALRAEFQRTPRTPPPSVPPPVLERPVSLAFTGDGPIVVRGSITGLTYGFPAGGEALSVDARDAAGILRSGVFRVL